MFIIGNAISRSVSEHRLVVCKARVNGCPVSISPPQQLTVTILDNDIIVQEVPVLSRFGMLLLLLSTVMLGLVAVSRRQN